MGCEQCICHVEKSCNDTGNVDVHTKTSDGKTLLHIAVANGLHESVIFLLSKGANPYDLNYQGRDSFWIARHVQPSILPLLEQGMFLV